MSFGIIEILILALTLAFVAAVIFGIVWLVRSIRGIRTDLDRISRDR